MNDHVKHTRLVLRLFLLLVVSLACKSTTIGTDAETPTAQSATSASYLGFDFANQTPKFPEGDASASLHLFLHRYPMPDNGSITGVAYLNDSDTTSESFVLLILRPVTQGLSVIHRIDLSDDNPPARTGTTLLTLPSPLSVEKNDIFAHWQSEAQGAIPLNDENASIDGLSIGQYGFRSTHVEIGESIAADGFAGQRDYFINIIFQPNP